MYTLKGEKSEFADRANLLQTGTVPRHKSERSQEHLPIHIIIWSIVPCSRNLPVDVHSGFSKEDSLVDKAYRKT